MRKNRPAVIARRETAKQSYGAYPSAPGLPRRVAMTVLAASLCLSAAASAEPKHKSKHAQAAPPPVATPRLCQLVDAAWFETGVTAGSQRAFIAHGELPAEAAAPGQHCMELNVTDQVAPDGAVQVIFSVLGMAMRTDHGTYYVTVDETGYAGGRPLVRYSVFAKNASITHLGFQVLLHGAPEPVSDRLTQAAGDARYLTAASADARYLRNDGREIVHFGDMLKLWHVPPVGPERGQNCLDFGLPQATDTGKDAAVMSMEAVSCKAGEFSLRWQLHSATTPER